MPALIPDVTHAPTATRMRAAQPLRPRLLLILAVSMAVAALAVPANAAPGSTAPGDTAPAPAAATTAAACSTPWGSTAKTSQVLKYTSAPITNLRAGRHECFDRLVVDLGQRSTSRSGQGNGYRVQYVNEVVESGSGNKVKVAGGAYLMINLNAAAHDQNGRPTYTPADRLKAVNVAGYSTFRQVAFLGTFEGQTDIAIGVRARLPMRVQFLAGPGKGSRMVIDVAHRW